MSSPEPAAGSSRGRPARGRAARIARAVLYWLAVVAISVALVVAFILFLESRDSSSLERGQGGARPAPAGPA